MEFLLNLISDPLIMQQTVRDAKKHGIKVGAHPGLPDLAGFGRRVMNITPEEGRTMVLYQTGALKAFLDAEDYPLHHIKPHGVLYGMMMKDYALSRAICEGVAAAFPGVKLFVHTGTFMSQAAIECGIPIVAEVAIDCSYTSEGSAVIERKKAGSDIEAIRRKTNSCIEDSRIEAIGGGHWDFPWEDKEITLCAHSDTPGCVEVVKAMRAVVDDFNAKYFPDTKREIE